jgi:hypothetical protein
MATFTNEGIARLAGTKITVLICRRAKSRKTGRCFSATKTWTRGPDATPVSQSFDAGTWFLAVQLPASNIRDLGRLLRRLEHRPDVFPIRGVPAPGVDLSRPVRRMKNPDPGGKIWFIEGGGQPWVLIDIDKLPVPEEIDPTRDPEGAIDYVVAHALPPELRGVTFVWQWSSSTGMKGPGLLSVHLWFWLDRPMTEGELGAWFNSNEWLSSNHHHLDPALFRLVQPHYTAAPIFDGVADPLSRRVGMRKGARDAATLPIPTAAPAGAAAAGGAAERKRVLSNPQTVRLPNRADDSEISQPSGLNFDAVSAARGFENKLALIGDGIANGVKLQGFHRVLTASAAAYVSEHGSALDRLDLKKRLRQAISAAPTRADRLGDTRRYSSDEYLDDVIDSAVERFGDEADARLAMRRLIPGVAPSFPAEPLPLEQAQALLKQSVAGWFDRTQRFHQAQAEHRKRLEQETEEALWRAARAAVDDDIRAGRDPWADQDDFDWRKVAQRIKSQVGARVAQEVTEKFGIDSFRHPPRCEIAAAAGIGKTKDVVDEILKRPALWQRNIWIFVPTIELADQLAERLADQFGLGPQVRVMRGRNAPDPMAGPSSGSPTTMCRKPEAATKAAQLGLSVFQALCANKQSGTRCQHYGTCAYIKQWDDVPGVRIFASEYLHLPKPLSLPAPDLVIVDESVVSTLTGELSFGLDRLSEAALQVSVGGLDSGDEIIEALRQVREGLESGGPLLSEIRKRIGQKQLRSAASALGKKVALSADVAPDMDQAEALRRLDGLEASERPKLVRLLRQLSREYSMARDECHSVALQRNAHVSIEGNLEQQARVRVWWRRKPRLRKSVPLLLIDADADHEINTKLFGAPLDHVPIAVERKATVTQCYTSRFSKSSLLAYDGAPTTGIESAEARLAGVKEVIRRLAAVRKILVVCPLPVRRAITGELEGKLPISATWEGAVISHFGRIRGVDDWKDFDGVIVVGAEQPPPDAVEATARAIWFDDPAPLLLPGEYDTSVRGYRLRSGACAGVRIRHSEHPDHRVQRVLELHRERGSAQAIDRLRLVHAETSKEVLILSNLPLDITIDGLKTWNEIQADGSRLERAYARSPGALPLVPHLLARQHPDLYATAKAAEHDVLRKFETPMNQINPIREWGVSKFRPYPTGRGGARRYSRAQLAIDSPGCRAQVEAAMGRTLEWEQEPTLRGYDPRKAAEVIHWETRRGYRAIWTPADRISVEIGRIGQSLGVVPFCAYQYDDLQFHDHIRVSPPLIQAGYFAVCSLLIAGDEIGWATAEVQVNAFIADITPCYAPTAAPGDWPERLLFEIATVAGERLTIERPFHTKAGPVGQTTV